MQERRMEKPINWKAEKEDELEIGIENINEKEKSLYIIAKYK